MSSSFRRKRPGASPAGSTTAATASSNAFATHGNDSGHAQRILRLPGTKPWTGGFTLTSSGLREIDAILGGGQPLGTCILVEEDRLTFDLGFCLARYWGAEAVACGQTLLLPATKMDDDRSSDWLDAPPSLVDDVVDDAPRSSSGTSISELHNFVRVLPRDLHLDKYRSRTSTSSKKREEEKSTDSAATSAGHKTSTPSLLTRGFDAIQEEEEEEDEDFDDEDPNAADQTGDDGLQIAWQYRTSIQKERLGRSTESRSSSSDNSSTNNEKDQSREVYCHSYDLAGRMIEQHDDATSFFQESGIDVVECACRETRQCGFELFRSLLQRIQHHLSNNASSVVRLLILEAPPIVTSIALPLLLAHTRANSLAVAVMVTVRPWLVLGDATKASALYSLKRTSDVVFSMDGFASFRDPPPPEFRELAGIMSIRKIASMGGGHFANATTGRRPPADRYGLKRDRRKLHVRLLHLPPEEESAGGSSTSGVRSGGGKVAASSDGGGHSGCGSEKTGESSLDF